VLEPPHPIAELFAIKIFGDWTPNKVGKGHEGCRLQWKGWGLQQRQRLVPEIVNLGYFEKSFQSRPIYGIFDPQKRPKTSNRSDFYGLKAVYNIYARHALIPSKK
jgi:hypothetical protein